MDDDGTTCAIEDWIYPLFIVANSHIARRQTGIAAPEINSFPIIAQSFPPHSPFINLFSHYLIILMNQFCPSQYYPSIGIRWMDWLL